MPRTTTLNIDEERLNCRHNCFNLPEIEINDCWLKNTCESCNKIKIEDDDLPRPPKTRMALQRQMILFETGGNIEQNTEKKIESDDDDYFDEGYDQDDDYDDEMYSQSTGKTKNLRSINRHAPELSRILQTHTNGQKKMINGQSDWRQLISRNTQRKAFEQICPPKRLNEQIFPPKKLNNEQIGPPKKMMVEQVCEKKLKEEVCPKKLIEQLCPKKVIEPTFPKKTVEEIFPKKSIEQNTTEKREDTLVCLKSLLESNSASNPNQIAESNLPKQQLKVEPIIIKNLSIVKPSTNPKPEINVNPVRKSNEPKPPIRQNPQRKAKQQKDNYYRRLQNGEDDDYDDDFDCVRSRKIIDIKETSAKLNIAKEKPTNSNEKCAKIGNFSEKHEDPFIVQLIKQSFNSQTKPKKEIVIDVNSNRPLTTCNMTEKTENSMLKLPAGLTIMPKLPAERKISSNKASAKEKKVKTTVIEIHTAEEPSARLKIANVQSNVELNIDSNGSVDDFMYEYNEELQACCEISLNETADDMFDLPNDQTPQKSEVSKNPQKVEVNKVPQKVEAANKNLQKVEAANKNPIKVDANKTPQKVEASKNLQKIEVDRNPQKFEANKNLEKNEINEKSQKIEIAEQPRKVGNIEKQSNQNDKKKHEKEKEVIVDDSYKCPKCSMTFHRKCKLDAHANSCNKQFESNQKKQNIEEQFPHDLMDDGTFPNMLGFLEDQESNDEQSKEYDSDDDDNTFYETKRRRYRDPSSVYALTKPYECDICHRSFSSRFVIEKHFERKHSANPKKSCRICKREFSTTRLLRRHWRSHEEGPFKCEICDKELAGLIGLEMHMRIHTGERPFKCKICFRSFAQTSSLSCHVRTHTGEKPYQCVICKKSFAQSSSLAAHRFVHNGQKPHACEHCNKRFSIRPQLRIHIQNRHSGSKPFKCEQCSKSFVQKLSLRYHMQRHTRENLLHCEYCPKTFARPVCLRLHTIRMHMHKQNDDAINPDGTGIISQSSSSAFNEIHSQFLQNDLQLDAAVVAAAVATNIEIPSRASSDSNNVNENAADHQSQPLENIECPTLVSITTTPIIDNEHQVPTSFFWPLLMSNNDLELSTQQLFTCDICGESFSQLKPLKRHIQMHRQAIKSRCDICQRQFTQRGSLLRHMHVHSTERPYKCKVCPKSFAHISYLIHHQYTHDTIKPFPCTICTKSFVIARALRKHMFRHAGVKPYGCSICGKTYMNKQSLDLHMKRHTGEDLFGCKLCPKKFVRLSCLTLHMDRHASGLPMYKSNQIF